MRPFGSGTKRPKSKQEKEHALSLADKEKFWAAQAASLGIRWDKPWDAVLDESDKPIYRWFKGAKLNTAYNVGLWSVVYGLPSYLTP